MTSADPVQLPDMMRAWAAGHLPMEAAVELLIGHGIWLDRLDQEGLIDVSEHVDDSKQFASIEWDDVVDRLDDTSGRLPGLGVGRHRAGDRRITGRRPPRRPGRTTAPGRHQRGACHPSRRPRIHQRLDVTIQRPHRPSILDDFRTN